VLCDNHGGWLVVTQTIGFNQPNTPRTSMSVAPPELTKKCTECLAATWLAGVSQLGEPTNIEVHGVRQGCDKVD